MSDQPVRVLVVGGASGYLGQLLSKHLSNSDVSRSLGLKLDVRVSTRAPTSTHQQLQLDLRDQTSIEAALAAFPPDVVINTAAISQPGLCEANEETANETNVPRLLVSALVNGYPTPFLIHLSTDQVYDGSRSNSTEEAPAAPINAYGRSKLKAEEVIRNSGCCHVILRSSIIVGPELPGVERPLFVQFIRDRLQQKIPTRYLVDEFRSPIYCHDICLIVQALIRSFMEQARREDDPDRRHRIFAHTFNMGGVERLSRLDMALAVASVIDFDGEEAVDVVDDSDNTKSKINSKANRDELIIPCTGAELNDRPYRSPADISMSSQAIYRLTGVQPLSFEEMLRKIIF